MDNNEPINRMNPNLSVFDEIKNIDAYTRLGETYSLQNVRKLISEVMKFCKRKLSDVDTSISISRENSEPEMPKDAKYSVSLVWKEHMWLDANGHQGPQRYVDDVECSRVLYYAKSIEEAKEFTKTFNSNDYSSYCDYVLNITPIMENWGK